MRASKFISASAILGIACGTISTAHADNFIIIGDGNALPADIYTKVSAAGGYLDKSYAFGVGVASSNDPLFAEKLLDTAAVRDVIEDVGFDVDYGAKRIEVQAAAEAAPPTSGDNDRFFDLQWGHNYVGSQAAWAKGFRGQNVRVAVLDGGFQLTHPDLAPNIIGSRDFTGQGINYACAGAFSHGNHVAGTIAAPDNGIGGIGVAPQAKLLLVKVLSENASCNGSGSFANVIAGIVYAADQGVHVINMSLGATIARQGAGGANADISALKNAVNKAITYATQKGVTVIVSGGNDGNDLDGGDKGAVRFNTGMSHAVGISALAPENWAGNGGNVPLDPAGYTNYGTSMIDFGAPGGDFDYPGNEGCTIRGVTAPCWAMDMVFSTGAANSYYWSAGTSMAAPHAAGVAALIISETGNSTPSHVLREMRKRAVDAGKPGRDDFFGHGISNSGQK